MITNMDFSGNNKSCQLVVKQIKGNTELTYKSNIYK